MHVHLRLRLVQAAAERWTARPETQPKLVSLPGRGAASIPGSTPATGARA